MAEKSLITDKDYKSLSLNELKKILNQKKQIIRKNYKELSEKEKIIRGIRKVDKLNEKIKKGVDIRKEWRKKSKKIPHSKIPSKIKIKIIPFEYLISIGIRLYLILLSLTLNSLASLKIILSWVRFS